MTRPPLNALPSPPFASLKTGLKNSQIKIISTGKQNRMTPRIGITPLIGLTFIVLAATGCQSASQYVSPQIEGRVLDSISRMPIEGVEVRRLSADDTSRSRQSSKGGELIMKG